MYWHTLAVYNSIITAVLTVVWGLRKARDHLGAFTFRLQFYRADLDTLLEVEIAIFASLTTVFWVVSSL